MTGQTVMHVAFNQGCQIQCFIHLIIC